MGLGQLDIHVKTMKLDFLLAPPTNLIQIILALNVTTKNIPKQNSGVNLLTLSQVMVS